MSDAIIIHAPERPSLREAHRALQAYPVDPAVGKVSNDWLELTLPLG